MLYPKAQTAADLVVDGVYYVKHYSGDALAPFEGRPFRVVSEPYQPGSPSRNARWRIQVRVQGEDAEMPVTAVTMWQLGIPDSRTQAYSTSTITYRIS